MFVDDLIAVLKRAKDLPVKDGRNLVWDRDFSLNKPVPVFKAEDPTLVWAAFNVPTDPTLTRLPYPQVWVDLGTLRDYHLDETRKQIDAKSEMQPIGRSCMMLREIEPGTVASFFWVEIEQAKGFLGDVVLIHYSPEHGDFEIGLPDANSTASKLMVYENGTTEVLEMPFQKLQEVCLCEFASSTAGFLKLVNLRSGVTWKKGECPPKVQKKRAKAGKAPLLGYHILHLDASLRESIHTDSRRPHDSPRKHWRRGHFKQRATGVFWWSAHLAGKDGFVDKSYVVGGGALEQRVENRPRDAAAVDTDIRQSGATAEWTGRDQVQPASS